MQRFFLIVLLFGSILVSAQFGKNCELRQFKLNAVNPGIEYEMALGTNTTFDLKLGLQATLDPSVSDRFEDFGFFPSLSAQYRYYYNFGKRQRNRRQIYGNSANYVAPLVTLFSPRPRTVAAKEVKGVFGQAGLVTGLQRSFNSGFNFSIDVGAAYFLGTINDGIYPVANLSIGWILSEKRWCVGK
ncbi:DUF3575 domain-containing protein [Maribacter sp.]|nr:DUF3575 domain-containing protein [Maribacter sp.]